MTLYCRRTTYFENNFKLMSIHLFKFFCHNTIIIIGVLSVFLSTYSSTVYVRAVTNPEYFGIIKA